MTPLCKMLLALSTYTLLNPKTTPKKGKQKALFRNKPKALKPAKKPLARHLSLPNPPLARQ